MSVKIRQILLSANQSAGKEVLEKTSMPRAGQSSTKPKVARGRINIPKPQQKKIQQMWAQGMSQRDIARAQKRCTATVRKIVHLPDMQKYIEEQREKLLGMAETALESIEYALETETDGRMAAQFFEKFGFFPSTAKQLPQQLDATQLIDVEGKVLTEEEKEERAIEEMCKRLAKTAMDRHKIFRTEMPELDEVIDVKVEVKGK